MIVGTAGHIDHGKTALVRALTGVDTDRLQEEKSRGITIDLGFAYMPAGDDEVLGFVDVPGHHRFVRNMLAGATGIDFVLLVIAADDGVMPQTREHLDIVSLLGLGRGAVALTKCDLVSGERRAEAIAEIEALLSGTPLAGSAIFPLSSKTGEGIEPLRQALNAASAEHGASQKDVGLFRLAVDRCFSLQGTGTVVTGAVLSGRVGVGDTVLLSPSGLSARVRSIHAQNRAVEMGRVGRRCALNLAGDAISVEAIARGDVVLDSGAHAPAERIDAELMLLASETRALAHWTPVRLHHAASETGARIALLQDTPIAPGTSGRVQLVLEHPIAGAVGDRFIIRDTSGARTLGGGRFIDLRGPQRRRKTLTRRAQLDALALKDPADALKALLGRDPFAVDITSFARDRVLDAGQLADLLARVPHMRADEGNDALLFSPDIRAQLLASAKATLETHHREYPQLLGLGIAALARQLAPRLPAKIGAAVIRAFIAEGLLASQGGAVHLPGHTLTLDKNDHRLWQRIEEHLSGAHRFRPPQGRECAKLLGAREIDVRRVLKAMAKQKRVIELAPDRFFLQEAVKEMATIAADIARGETEGVFAAAQFRDRLQNGRKVSIEVLEYFDRNGLTLRKGDLRHVVPHRIAAYLGESENSRPEDQGGIAAAHIKAVLLQKRQESKAIKGRESSPVGRPDFKSGWGC